MESIIAVDIKSLFFSNMLTSEISSDSNPVTPPFACCFCYCNDGMEALNVRHEMRAVSLDIFRAFDTILNLALISKLTACGPMILKANSIHGFLNPYTTIDNTWLSIGSSDLPSMSWLECPQSSVLGPVLFLIFINDLSVWKIPYI